MNDCKNCNETGCGEAAANTPATIPFVVHEAAMEMADRREKRWMITCFILLGMIMSMIIGFLIYESQFETYYYTQDGADINIIGDTNEVGAHGTKTEDQEKAGQ